MNILCRIVKDIMVHLTDVPDCNSFLAYACSMVENNITDAKYSGP
jgi:hypothetical protein